ncbi:hypothetical protein AMAG_15981 [Allomyces macrogynus ATCC 38327]|uniref:Uncharacterized protein n=1 Tax=Allomyces macrogynus (strain ATCC 38327) TaxID=578462 RepID=A0A0L0TB71_ALLM3|nr:hypothetical protein AMAG_15981 [Allomyces macrogynus ATCC 38327]|eukprot:KNE72038.1 hypothetical protein AMAG_15981 [Allomyces macrogynus ATCC 38327]
MLRQRPSTGRHGPHAMQDERSEFAWQVCDHANARTSKRMLPTSPRPPRGLAVTLVAILIVTLVALLAPRPVSASAADALVVVEPDVDFAAQHLLALRDPSLSANAPGACSNGTCTAHAGEYCLRAVDCASFSVLGDAACSATCALQAQCSVSGDTFRSAASSAQRCCHGLPLGATCILPGRRGVPQCATGLKCLPPGDDEAGKAMCATKPPSSRWVIGVVISVIGGVVLNLGLNLQKLSFRRAAAIPEPVRPPPYRQPIWVVGFTVWILANLASFVALSFAAQSLIAALGAVSLVANAVAAPVINKEPFGKLDALAIVLISTGTVVIVAFASHDEAEYTLCALMLFYRRPSVIAYLTVTVAVIVGLWAFIGTMDAHLARIEHARVLAASLPRHASGTAASGTDSDRDTPTTNTSKTLHRQSTASAASVAPAFRASSSSTISSAASTRPLARPTTASPRWLARVGPTSVAARYMLPLAYAALGGMLGGLTVLLAKSAAELIVTTAQGENQFRFVATYLILVGIAVTGVGQVVYINAGLQRYDALVQVPAFYVVYTLCGIVSGGLYFDEFHALSGTQFALFSVGVVLTFLGVACLAGRLGQSKPSESTGLVRDNDVPLDALGRPDWDAYDARLGGAHQGAKSGTVASPVLIDDGDGVTVGPGARSPSPNALVHRLARQRMPSDVLFLTGEPSGSGSGELARPGVETAAVGSSAVEPASPGRAMSPRLRASGARRCSGQKKVTTAPM